MWKLVFLGLWKIMFDKIHYITYKTVWYFVFLTSFLPYGDNILFNKYKSKKKMICQICYIFHNNIASTTNKNIFRLSINLIKSGIIVMLIITGDETS